MAEKKKLGLSRHYGYLWLLFSAAGCKKIAKLCAGGCKTVSEAFYRKMGAEN
jgi:hypothetical protein